MVYGGSGDGGDDVGSGYPPSKENAQSSEYLYLVSFYLNACDSASIFCGAKAQTWGPDLLVKYCKGPAQ
jgi:hypothetical protein